MTTIAPHRLVALGTKRGPTMRWGPALLLVNDVRVGRLVQTIFVLLNVDFENGAFVQ